MLNKLVNAPGLKDSTTRRQLLTGGLTLGTTLAVGTTAMAVRADPQGADASIHQEIDFKASPSRIYECLLSQKQFAAFTKSPAQIHREAGGPFKLFGGRIGGRNIELIPDERIVQAWRVEAWPPGIYSIARFELKAQDSGCRIVFDHTGFPPADREGLNSGWSKMYWNPLRKYLDS